MLGKQWLNRYLQHTGGSMVERCGDRQRKCEGLERWPFHFFVESLSIMLQIALLLLTCGLSRYMWSINTSVARVVISFTILGILFYIGIVIAGTSSYECPFQTPASIALRDLQGSRKIQKILTNLSPLMILLFIPFTWRGIRTGLSRGARRAREAVLNPSSWNISLSSLASGIRVMSRKIAHQSVILLLRVDQAFGNVKQMVIQGIQQSKSALSLPMSTVQEHAPHLVGSPLTTFTMSESFAP